MTARLKATKGTNTKVSKVTVKKGNRCSILGAGELLHYFWEQGFDVLFWVQGTYAISCGLDRNLVLWNPHKVYIWDMAYRPTGLYMGHGLSPYRSIYGTWPIALHI